MKRVQFLSVVAILGMLVASCVSLPAAPAQPPAVPEATSGDAVLSLHLEGGLVGFCDDLSIWGDGRAAATSCKAAVSSEGQLTAEEAAQLESWLEALAPFTVSVSEREAADGMSIELAFSGRGGQTASENEKADIAGFAQQVLLRLRKPPAAPAEIGIAVVESVEVQVLDGAGPSVLVIARGSLPDGCTSIDETSWRQEGDTFYVTITTYRPQDMMCTQVIVPFEETVMIEPEAALAAGAYTVSVNGVSAQFEIK